MCQSCFCFEPWHTLSSVFGIYFSPFTFLCELAWLCWKLSKFIFNKHWRKRDLLAAHYSISHNYIKCRNDPGLGDNWHRKPKCCLDPLSVFVSHVPASLIEFHFLLLQPPSSIGREQRQSNVLSLPPVLTILPQRGMNSLLWSVVPRTGSHWIKCPCLL